jgi:hypothetical protein
MKPILLLGGYGAVGRHLAPWLLQETDTQLLVAGRNEKKAGQLAAELNHCFGGRRVAAQLADAALSGSLRPALARARMVVVCTPTMEHTPLVAREALAEDIDYLDMHFPARIVPILRQMQSEVESRGRCFITQAGFHPGLLAPLVHFSAPHFTAFRQVSIAMQMRFRFPSLHRSAAELMETVDKEHMQVFADGRWRPGGRRDFKTFDFGPGFGKRSCAPLDFVEMHDLPRTYGLEQVGCYAAGFKWFTDHLVFPAAWFLNRLHKGLAARLLSRWFVWGVNTFSSPPWGVVLRLDAAGDREGKPCSFSVVLRHPDMYELTALAVVACLKQYLDGSIARPGVWLMGEVVEPIRIFHDLERMGVRIETSAPFFRRASTPSEEGESEVDHRVLLASKEMS